MSMTTLACQQAIFTSIRGPMGEGYRIVAAGQGLATADKQAITRNSPSHEALCHPEESAGEQTMGMSFYALPSKRLCVAYSCLAGAEHTGRGGDRVYTHCVVFEAARFADCAYNPFHVLRAMARAGLTTPELKPPAVLPEVDLEVETEISGVLGPRLPVSLGTEHRCKLLDSLLSARSAVVDLPSSWLPCAEAIFFGLPGPMRAEVSLSTGLRFSTGRRHQLQFLHDEKNILRTRLAGQPVELFDPLQDPSPGPCYSRWVEFVERQWARSDFRELNRRTGRPFEHFDDDARERIGGMYNTLDTLPQRPPVEMVHAVREAFECACGPGEEEIRGELAKKAQQFLNVHVGRMKWADADAVLRPLVAIWRMSAEGGQFAQPMLEKLLRASAAESPLMVAEALLLIDSEVPHHVEKFRYEALANDVLRSLANLLQQPDLGPVRARAETLVSRWQRVHPDWPVVQSFANAAVP